MNKKITATERENFRKFNKHIMDRTRSCMRLSIKAVMPTNFIVFDVRNDASRSKVGMDN